VKLVSQIASSDSCTVVSIIHQPSKEMLEQFSHLCLLDKGELAFLGPIEELKPFFDSIGWPIGEKENPAEKVITVMDELRASKRAAERRKGSAKAVENGSENTAEKADDVNNARTEESTEHARSLPDLFVQSKQHSDNVRSVEMMKETTPESSRAAQQPQVPPRPRFFKLQRTRTKDRLPQTVSEPGFIAPRVYIRIAFTLILASRNTGSEHSSSLKSHILKSHTTPRHAYIHPHDPR
jgi:hypothetical protein